MAIEEDKVAADFRNGVPFVTLPKPEKGTEQDEAHPHRRQEHQALE
ncbi:hypothetical protein [Mesorhizobium sp.]|nr:hypothetical protein [Mesorhizobium sp.]